MLKQRSVHLLCGLSALTLLAATEANATVDSSGMIKVDQSQKITNGEEAETCAYPSVAATMIDDGQGGQTNGCSATLVHPELLVLAAHCIHPMEGSKVQSIVFGESAESPVREVEVVACRGHMDYRGEGEGVDLAFCVLKEAITDIPVTPIALGCELDEVKEGSRGTIVGWGASLAVNRIPLYTEGSGVKRFTDQEIVQVADQIFVQGGSQNSACYGDSGGPLFQKLEDGQTRLIGVASHIHIDESWDADNDPSGLCGQGAYYQSVAPYVAWIEEQTRRDITPCFDAQGNWDPNELCRDFAIDPEAVSGSWDESEETNGSSYVCLNGGVSGWVSTCGEPLEDEKEEEPESEEESGEDGGSESAEEGGTEGSDEGPSSEGDEDKDESETKSDGDGNSSGGCSLNSSRASWWSLSGLVFAGLLFRRRRLLGR